MGKRVDWNIVKSATSKPNKSHISNFACGHLYENEAQSIVLDVVKLIQIANSKNPRVYYKYKELG